MRSWPPAATTQMQPGRSAGASETNCASSVTLKTQLTRSPGVAKIFEVAAPRACFCDSGPRATAFSGRSSGRAPERLRSRPSSWSWASGRLRLVQHPPLGPCRLLKRSEDPHHQFQCTGLFRCPICKHSCPQRLSETFLHQMKAAACSGQ